MMRAVALALLVIAISAPAVVAMEQPDVELLLDLDLLHESDPRLQSDVPAARHVRLLELLERLNQPAAARGSGDSRPAGKAACS